MKSALLRYLPLLILALAWEAAARLGIVSSLALPPLSKVLVAWVDLIKDGELWSNGLASLYRAGAGLSLAIVVGAALGIVHGVVAAGACAGRPAGRGVLSDAEVGAHSGDRAVARASATVRRSC